MIVCLGVNQLSDITYWPNSVQWHQHVYIVLVIDTVFTHVNWNLPLMMRINTPMQKGHACDHRNRHWPLHRVRWSGLTSCLYLPRINVADKPLLCGELLVWFWYHILYEMWLHIFTKLDVSTSVASYLIVVWCREHCKHLYTEWKGESYPSKFFDDILEQKRKIIEEYIYILD